jgi:hypothetical protein
MNKRGPRIVRRIVETKEMTMQIEGRGLGRVLIALLSLGAGHALAQNTIQTLDRTNVFNRTTVLETAFDDAARLADFSVSGITATAGLTHCQLGIDNGLWCLDGLVIRNWADPESATGAGTFVATCADSKLGLDTKKPADTCPAMTIDQAGAIWIVGKKGSVYNLYKLTKGSACEGAALAQGAYCFRVYASGGRVSDITPIDGEAGTLFNLGPGTLGVQGGADLVFYDDAAGTAVKVLVPGKAWKLATQETVQTATLLQLRSQTGVVRNFALVSTSQGRILAVDTATATPAPFTVFNAPAERPAGATPCNTLAAQYAIRSGKSGHVYLTDRNYCLASALQSAAPPTGDTRPFVLANVQEDNADLTFNLTASYPPDGVTVAPGIVVNLAECAGECTVLSDAGGDPALKLSGVSLVGLADKATLFLAKGLTDCRWVPLPKPAFCSAPGVILPAGETDPTRQYLNVTPQLPQEIQILYQASGGLPPLLMPPKYRALDPAFTFDAFFFKPQPGLKFDGSFGAEYFVERLTANNHPCETPNAQTIEDFRKFGVVTQISETWQTVGGPSGLGHVAMLLNTGCGSTTTLKPGRLSLFPFNLEPTPTGDRVLIDLLLSLSDDWEATRAQLACTSFDSGTSAPLNSSVCSSLRSAWVVLDDKLEKCVQELTLNSNTAANCSSFEKSQFPNFQTTVESLTATGSDPANRVVELKVRLSVIEDLYYRRVKPSYLP